ncbi:hypothetical protein BLNAU_10215 [Blattamonas nauphoetae]|uniref:Uncharacterized protein n=1 Tax=Blattamonas nauphoetae TaxID=2049346 RepID=A0ABQ9XTS8_9EUKA|nr:hypothetical protein BLNAU_10215 [Blattamonas nauphoetae]
MIYEKTGIGTHPGAVLCALERLLLASNLLPSLSLIESQFQNLHTLSLAGNGISELYCHFFLLLPKLSRLDFTLNELTHLPESIGSGNTKRISLDVSFNKWTSLPHFLVDSNSSLDSSQLLSLRQRFFGTCPPHTPVTLTLASPVGLTLDGSGSRPFGIGRGIEVSSVTLAGVSFDVWASSDRVDSYLNELNNADSSRPIVEHDGSQSNSERAVHPHISQHNHNENKKDHLLMTTNRESVLLHRHCSIRLGPSDIDPESARDVVRIDSNTKLGRSRVRLK